MKYTCYIFFFLATGYRFSHGYTGTRVLSDFNNIFLLKNDNILWYKFLVYKAIIRAMRSNLTVELDCRTASKENETVTHIRVLPQLTSFVHCRGNTICATCGYNELPQLWCSANSTLFPHFDMLLRQTCDGTTNCAVTIYNVSMNLVCNDCDVTQSCLADCVKITYACEQVEGSISLKTYKNCTVHVVFVNLYMYYMYMYKLMLDVREKQYF